jgi:B-box zinc finger
MNCVNHPQTAATAYCRTCGKALCAACARNVHGVIYCEECLAARIEGQPVVAPAAAPGVWAPPVVDRGPNPAVAGILSGFLPFGTGAMYCGEYTRALVQAGIFFGLIAIQHPDSDTAGVLHGLAIAFWYFFMIVDSVRVARAKQLGQPVPDLLGIGLGHPSESVTGVSGGGTAPTSAIPGEATIPMPQRRVPIGPLLLIGLGVLLMLGVSDVWFFSLDRTWPFIVIGVGIWMLFSRVGGWSMGYGEQGWNMRTMCCSPTRLMAPAMVITTGVLGLLYEYTSWSWGRTWPLYLIVAGGIKMLQFTGPREDHIGPPSAPPSAPAAESQVTHG